MKSGFIGIVGRPNVGKSTLMNAIIGEKVAITSGKAQTTRNIIRGIYTDDAYQLIFIDTPGIHKPKNKLGAYLTNTAVSTLNEVDVILFLTDGALSDGPGDKYILELLKKAEKKDLPFGVLILIRFLHHKNLTSLAYLYINPFNIFILHI